MRDSLAHREVIVFEGHSGPLYGFALANWRKTDEGDMDDSKLPTAEMPRSYQIVLANGCDTYDLGQAFWLESGQVGSRRASTSSRRPTSRTRAPRRRRSGCLKALFNQTSGKLVPVKVSELTHGLDGDQGYGFSSMYGVHGVDHDPKYDPMSDAATLCRTVHHATRAAAPTATAAPSCRRARRCAPSAASTTAAARRAMPAARWRGRRRGRSRPTSACPLRGAAAKTWGKKSSGWFFFPRHVLDRNHASQDAQQRQEGRCTEGAEEGHHRRQGREEAVRRRGRGAAEADEPEDEDGRRRRRRSRGRRARRLLARRPSRPPRLR